MLGICFRHGPGTPQTQWSYLCSMYGINHMWERKCGDRESERGVIQIDFISELPDFPLILIQPNGGRYIQGQTSLINFVHPEDAIYIFGGDHDNFSEDDLNGRSLNHFVYIPQNTQYELHSPLAGATVLYDRLVKRGCFG